MGNDIASKRTSCKTAEIASNVGQGEKEGMAGVPRRLA